MSTKQTAPHLENTAAFGLQIRNLHKSFGDKKIIRDLSLEVRYGEILGFLGPNGAGKTTTIKMVMGFLFPDAGEIFINGHDLRREYEQALAGIGGIVENPEVYLNLSGLRNLQMYARLHDGVTSERIRDMIELVGLENRINDHVKKYSLGMKQRLGLAQALLHRPRTLILDEPTNGLDPAGIRKLRDILKNLAHREGLAIMVSSHLMSEMELMCDRVAIIDQGKIVAVKAVSELMQAATGESRVILRATPLDTAKTVVDSFEGATLVRQNTIDELEIAIENELVPDLLNALASAGVRVFAVQHVEASLEDAFIKATGHSRIS
ncbi:MAG: ABC transporter ATP-binding protein [Clostridiaceae bacterium]|nr:ABC transporter ATP-binding protein [Clostridiaceae bacterium]